MTDKELLDQLEVGTKSEMITNPYTGQSRLLEPLAVALHDYIKGCEAIRDGEHMSQALGIFVERWPEEYYVLLD